MHVCLFKKIMVRLITIIYHFDSACKQKQYTICVLQLKLIAMGKNHCISSKVFNAGEYLNA